MGSEDPRELGVQISLGTRRGRCGEMLDVVGVLESWRCHKASLYGCA